MNDSKKLIGEYFQYILENCSSKKDVDRMSLDSDSLLQYALIFFLIGTVIQILAWRKTKTHERKERKQIKSFLSRGDPVETARGTNDPLVFEKVDEQTFQKIDKIMKGGYK